MAWLRTGSRPDTGNKRATEAGLSHLKFQEGDACNLEGVRDHSFDMTVSIFGTMFAPKPFDVGKEMARVTKLGGRIVMGNWIPTDSTFVSQVLKISSGFTPPPPEGFVSPMSWGVESHIIDRFGQAGVPKENISMVKDTYCILRRRNGQIYEEVLVLLDLAAGGHWRLGPTAGSGPGGGSGASQADGGESALRPA